MPIDPKEQELRDTFFKERLALQGKHQTDVKALQATQVERLRSLRRAPPPPAAPAAVPVPAAPTVQHP